MNHFTIRFIFVVLSIASNNTYGLTTFGKARYCVMEQTNKMVGYNCAKLQLRSVPTNIESSVEVLNLSQNRIRELTRESFSSLTDLRFLYIFDNAINQIEDDTFAKLTNLEALDLSGNGLLEVPPEIFNLPLLRNLYISDNSFGDRGFDKLQTIPKPIKAPIKILSIANNRLSKIPDFGILPELYKLNISSNPMRDLTSQQFSPFCHMKEIDLNNTAMEKCRCEEVTRFLLKKRIVDLATFSCDITSSECETDFDGTISETQDYLECKISQFESMNVAQKTGIPMWGLIAFGFVCLLLIITGWLYCGKLSKRCRTFMG